MKNEEEKRGRQRIIGKHPLFFNIILLVLLKRKAKKITQ